MFSRVSHAWQSWKSAKAVALLAILALAIGIGATTAIYTVVDAVLLKPLPYEHSERFVALYSVELSRPTERGGLSYADLLEYQHRSRSFDVFGWFVYTAESGNLIYRGHPEHVNCLSVSPSLVSNLGTKLTLGRWFQDPSRDPGGYNVTVLSNALWRRLGADPSISGKSLKLGDQQFTVIGVAPPGFRFPLVGVDRQAQQNDLWIPLDPRIEARDPTSGIYICYARLRPGVTLAAGDADVKRVAAQIARADPANHPSYSARLETLRDSAVADVRPALLLIFGAAGLLFLITCANVAGLLLARSIARARDTAVRVALGATRIQLAWQFFLEGLLISFAGAALGMFVAVALVRLVLSIAGQYDPFADQTSLNVRVFLFVFGIALLATALFSCAPLWQAFRTSPNSVLTEGVRASTTLSSRRLSQSLVVAEIALAFTLLGISALLLAQLSKLYRVSPGFDSDDLLTFAVTADPSRYPDSAFHSYQRQLLGAIEATPGVSGATFTNELPLAGCCFATKIYPEGSSVDPQAVQSIDFHGVSPNYFRVMRIPLYSGRFLNERDTSETLIAAVIDRAAAKHYWPNRDPVGAYGHFRTSTGPRFQVVGVVGDVRNKGLSEVTEPEIYLASAVFGVNPMNLIVRSPVPPNTLVPALRRAVLKLDPTQPIYDVMPMSGVIKTSLTLPRFSSVMMIVFALVAVVMAALGIYGVVSYSVRQRTVEIGTRMALGAENRDLFQLVLGEGFRMAAYAVAIGAVAITAATWFLVQVFGIVRQVDALPLVYSLLLVVLITFAASFFPAWRATLLTPMVAIRNESLSLWESSGRGIRQLLTGVSTGIAHSSGTPAIADATLLSDFINATRQAATFDEALRLALATLCGRLSAASAMLLENISGTEYSCIAAEPAELMPCPSLPAPGFLSNRVRFYSLPLPITAGDLTTWLHWAIENRPEYVPEIEAISETKARIAVPLRTKTEILGILLLGPPLARSEYNGFELRLLRNCAEQFALMLENARLTGRVVEQEKLRRDVTLAVEVQKRLLPERSPDSQAASLAAVSVPARSVGGDYYDFLDIGDHRIGIALADIAGKGVAAALLMAVVQASLRIISSEEGVSLPQLAARMNRYLYRSTGANGYATFFYAQLDESTRQLRYVNAGHNPPYLLRSATGSTAAAEIEELSTGGIVIGMFPQAKYEEATLNLESGDVLVLFTDGVTEALSPGEEEFGEERLKSLLREYAHLPVAEMSSAISRELRSWISNADQHDDLTFIVLKVN